MNRFLLDFGSAQLPTFLLVLARVSPLFIFAPMFSSKMLPPRVRGIAAVALAIGLMPAARTGVSIPTDPLPLAGLILKEIVVGMAFAFSLHVLFAAISAAGALLDTLVGFSYGGLVDPVTGNQSSVLAQVYSLVAVLIFITIGGDAWVITGLAKTYSVVPVTGFPPLGSVVGTVVHAFTEIFVAMLEVAAPVLLAAVVTDAAFGVVSRVVPQLNVFAVGFPAKVGVAFVLLAASLPFLAGWIADHIGPVVGQAVAGLGGG